MPLPKRRKWVHSEVEKPLAAPAVDERQPSREPRPPTITLSTTEDGRERVRIDWPDGTRDLDDATDPLGLARQVLSHFQHARVVRVEQTERKT